MTDPIVVAEQLPFLERQLRHDRATTECPRCTADLSRVGIVHVAYVFDTCSCGVADYAHLVEQLWHRECLAAEAGEAAEVALTERVALVAEAKRETLAQAQIAIMLEARRGEKAAPPAQHLTYSGGLRRAARMLDALLGEVRS